VRQNRYQNRKQLVLELERTNLIPLVERGAKGLVETLADLLLEALGDQGLSEMGGRDEHEDHA
jgi:hypothetical protein